MFYSSLSLLHSPLLMICCDLNRQNTEIAQGGIRNLVHDNICYDYSAQHAETEGPVDPFPPLILFIWRKGYIVSYSRCTIAPLCTRKGELLWTSLPRMAISCGRLGKNTEHSLYAESSAKLMDF